MTEPVMTTDLPLANKRTGKVRDLYDVTLPDGDDGLLIVATDRVSVFDVVLSNGIAGKGVLLTRISKFWFDFFADSVDHHLISVDQQDIPGLSDAQRATLEGRIMICRKTRVVPVECIVRGYLTGSGYKDYVKSGQVCGIALPAGMVNSDRIESPIFTPSTKAEQGHDENISFEAACDLVGGDLMEAIRARSLHIYNTGREYARERGIIIADTKFEFGLLEGHTGPVLIDEVLTPDSSRFWPADEWTPGQEQNSFDKQYVRNYTQGLVDKGEWDKEYPGPALPDEVIDNTIARYEEALARLTG
ncbi:MAG: phosphoribosylaminoimidazolesuccinocarboxamide synthase [Proteobacteria bacterium]|nr:phosphoribosylaminoimidazolesuccinocarboxamide synthase [Pseudomonadota bacterium]MDA1299826.1 phosphoribosylaminoimidazolesuccinocarboxamide synthase [Pseudomonadota bacterium]